MVEGGGYATIQRGKARVKKAMTMEPPIHYRRSETQGSNKGAKQSGAAEWCTRWVRQGGAVEGCSRGVHQRGVPEDRRRRRRNRGGRAER